MNKQRGDQNDNLVSQMQALEDKIAACDRLSDKLKESERKYRAIFDTSPAGIAVLDEGGALLDVNDRMHDWLGYERGEIVGKKLFDLPFLTEASKRLADINLKRRFAGETIGPYELEFVRRDNGTMIGSVSANLMRDDAGGVAGDLAMITDVTKDRRAEREIKHALDDWQRTFDATADLIFHVDKDHVVTRANRATAEFLGMQPADIIGKPCYALIHGTDAPAAGCPMETAKKTKARAEAEMYIARRDRWILATADPILDEEGNVVAAVHTIRDITERKRAEREREEYSDNLAEMVEERTRELQAAQEKLIRKEKLAILGQMAGSVGHELRNPLAVINNTLYLLRKVAGGEGKARAYLDIIAAQVRASEKIISDLLNLSRTKPAERRSSSVEALIGAAIHEAPPPEGVSIIKRLDPALPAVFADPLQIGQVITNIVRNAYDAMPGGGTLTIAASAGGNEVRIAVADTGHGMSAKTAAVIFEPLYTTKPGGIGLGLTVSKSLAEINGGRIEVESCEGKGTTFTVVLPKQET